MSSPQEPSKLARTRDATRQRILRAARSLFGAEGFDGTSVRRIAQEVGLSEAALYHYFKSKREILNAIWELPIQGPLSRLRPDGAFCSDQLNMVVDAVLDFTVANDHFLRLMCREILSGDQTALALRRQSRSILRRTLHEHFLTVVSDGEAEIRTEAVMALVTGTSMKSQLAAGADFARTVEDAAYRERTQRWARCIARLDETDAD